MNFQGRPFVWILCTRDESLPGMGRTDAESPRLAMAFCQVCVRLSSDDPGAVETSSAACDSHRPLGVRGTSAASTPADGTYLESVRWRGRRRGGAHLQDSHRDMLSVRVCPHGSSHTPDFCCPPPHRHLQVLLPVQLCVGFSSPGGVSPVCTIPWA